MVESEPGGRCIEALSVLFLLRMTSRRCLDSRRDLRHQTRRKKREEFSSSCHGVAAVVISNALLITDVICSTPSSCPCRVSTTRPNQYLPANQPSEDDDDVVECPSALTHKRQRLYLVFVDAHKRSLYIQSYYKAYAKQQKTVIET